MRSDINPQPVHADPAPPSDPVLNPVPAGWSPFAVASLRGMLTALLAGAATFLTTWTTTSDAKTLAIATATVVVSILSARMLGEGTIDQARTERRANR